VARCGGGGIVAAQGVPVALKIDCPHCGLRPYTEFTFDGELRDLDSPDAGSDFERVYLPTNGSGPQRERWFHAFGCRRWLTLTRDTLTNRIDAIDRVRG
jgi:methylglutamate dehydrogenase subunit B